ncbi:MAG: acetamidase/formamidase family protein [Methylocystaceae bacterium]
MRISKNHYVYSLDQAHEPAAQVDLPCRLTFETFDCFQAQVKQASDTLDTVDFTHINPATGPVYFNQLKPGDVLKVNIRDIRCQSPGVMMVAPGMGVMGDVIKQSATVLVPVSGNHITLFGFSLPARPMIGVIGLAPASEGIPTGTPGSHGGNMDTNLISAGTSIYFPVQVEGGLLAMGDLHALMGDGEICGTGVEVNGEVDVTVERAFGLTIDNPLLVTPDLVCTIYSDLDLDIAVKGATANMTNLITQYSDLDLSQATMLMSICGNAQISQVVDPAMTARFTMPRTIMKQLGVAVAF